MTKRRPSIKGRGAEILFGESSPPPVEPLATELETAGGEPWAEVASLEEAAMASDLPLETGQEAEAEAISLPELLAGAELPAVPALDLPDVLEKVFPALATGFEPGPHVPVTIPIIDELETTPAEPAAEPAAGEGGYLPAAEPENVPLLEVEGLVEERPPAIEAIPVLSPVVDVPSATAGGGAPAGEAESGERASASTATAGLGPPESEDELEGALYEEARDAEPGAELEVGAVSAAAQPEADTSREMEAAFFEEATAAEEPPEPVAEIPIPTPEATMEELAVSTEAAINQPPPPETTGDIGASVVPPRPPRQYFDMGTALAMPSADIQEPDSRVETVDLNRELSEEDQKKLLARLGPTRLGKLDREITQTYNRVTDVLGDNEDLANEAYNLLLKARDIVWLRVAGRIAQAEYYLEQVQARLKRAEDSMRDAHRYQYRILGWGGAWFVIYLAMLILMGHTWFRDVVTPAPDAGALLDLRIFVPAMIWGGLGGVTAVWYSLFKHVGRRDFDSAFNLSYVGKPFLGLILGAAVYMVFHLLMRTLGVLPAGLEGREDVDIIQVSPWIIYLVAWAGGFKENRVFDLVDKVMKQIFSSDESTPPAAPEEPVATS